MRSLALAVLLVSALPAQNLLVNGDFELSRLYIAPWFLIGSAIQPRIEIRDTSGTGPSQAFAGTPDPGYAIAQYVTLVEGTTLGAAPKQHVQPGTRT